MMRAFDVFASPSLEVKLLGDPQVPKQEIDTVANPLALKR